MVIAQNEARRLNHIFIGTEHLLIGILHDGEGLSARALQRYGVGLAAVQEMVGETAGEPQRFPAADAPPFSPRAKKVLDLSLREALQLGHNYIGAEHVLLAIIREGGGVGAHILIGLGADLVQVREVLLGLMASGAAPSPSPAQAVPSGAVSGPVCPGCARHLAHQLTFIDLEAAPHIDSGRAPDLGNPSDAAPRLVTVVFCAACGTTQGILPSAGPGRDLR